MSRRARSTGGLCPGIGRAARTRDIRRQRAGRSGHRSGDYTPMPRADGSAVVKGSRHYADAVYGALPLGVKRALRRKAGAIGSSGCRDPTRITDATVTNNLKCPGGRRSRLARHFTVERGGTIYEDNSHRPSSVDEAAAMFARVGNRRTRPVATRDPGHEAAGCVAIRRDHLRTDQGTGGTKPNPTDGLVVQSTPTTHYDVAQSWICEESDSRIGLSRFADRRSRRAGMREPWRLIANKRAGGDYPRGPLALDALVKKTQQSATFKAGDFFSRACLRRRWRTARSSPRSPFR